jgi:hypothetical protein
MQKMQGLDLQSPGVVSRLVNICSTESTNLLINPSEPTASAIYTKLNTPVPYGSPMPFGMMPLDSATIACVLAWATQVSEDAGTTVSCTGDQ